MRRVRLRVRGAERGRAAGRMAWDTHAAGCSAGNRADPLMETRSPNRAVGGRRRASGADAAWARTRMWAWR